LRIYVVLSYRNYTTFKSTCLNPDFRSEKEYFSTLKMLISKGPELPDFSVLSGALPVMKNLDFSLVFEPLSGD